MRINRVRLKNYRTHKDISLEFDRGMNLLLGANGAGKSSVLEAIGITLFDSKYRDGTSKGQKQVIRYGEKQALVEIEFTANDGDIYIIENQLKTSGTGYTRLYRIDERDEMLTVSTEIREKLRTLVGIERGLTDIYDNIIVAKQNEFINLYKLKPRDRKDAFNTIFETEIYEEMSGEYGKKVEDEYKNQIKKVEGEIGALGEHIEDRDMLLQGMRETLEKKQRIYEEEKAQKEARDLILRELTSIEELKNELGLLRNNLISQEKLLLKIEGDVESNRYDIEVSKKSQDILKAKEMEYLEYEKFGIQEMEQRRTTHELELKNDKFLSLEREWESSKAKVGELTGKIEKFQAEVKGQLNMKGIFMEKEEELQRELFEKESAAREIEQNLSKIVPLMDVLLELESQEENHIREERDLKIKVENLLKGLKDKELRVIDLSLETLEKEIESLEKKVKEKDEIKNQISNARTLLASNQEAKESLAGARCPFLKERCKNLEDMDIETYFLEREREYSQTLKSNLEALALIEKEVERLDSFKQKFYQGRNLEGEIEKEKSSLELVEVKRENISLKIGALRREIEKVSSEQGDLETLQEKRSNWKAKYETLNIGALKKNILDVRKDIEGVLYGVESLNRNILSLEENRKDILERGELLYGEIEMLKEYPLRFQEEKENLKILQQEMEKRREAHSLYNKNMESAKMLERFLEKETKLLQERAELTEKRREISKRLEEKIAILPPEEKVEEMAQRRKESQERIESLAREAGILESGEREFLVRLQKVDEGLGKMRETVALKNRLEKKKELVEIFRENLRKMGNRVAENIIKEISFYATTNFRKITGRGESIEWSNFDSEGKESPYSVALKGGDTHITFEQLSGGEQVAVAIAIRGAMNSLFTKAAFAIFDEPTNNLDIERRKSLADNIGEILKDLDQSIIVTHDDTFREMAQKVIEL